MSLMGVGVCSEQNFEPAYIIASSFNLIHQCIQDSGIEELKLN